MNCYRRILLFIMAFGAATVVLGEPTEAIPDDMSNQKTVAGDQRTDSLNLDATSIRGNQELPKVLYIVPWKDSALGVADGRPASRLVDEVLAPVDREVFLRQERYFEQLYSAPVNGD
jgi:hypothetical protein